MLSGDNGLLKRAGDARDETIVGQEKETIALAYMACVCGVCAPINAPSIVSGKVKKQKNKITT